MNHNLKPERENSLISIAPKIAKTLWMEEAELRAQKWYEYRMDDPVSSTEQFAEEYIRIFREYHVKYKDLLEAEKKQPIKSSSLLELSDSETTSLWKARQSADRFGLPYSSYIRKAFETLVDRRYKKLPRPNQLYSPPVLRAIEEYCSGDTPPCPSKVTDERFLDANFNGSTAQNEFRADLMGKLRESRPKIIQITNVSIWVFDRGFLPPELIIDEFGSEILERARQTAETPACPTKPFNKSDFEPSCFGVPHITAEHSPCSDCARSPACHSLRTEVENSIIARTGSIDPKAEHKRQLARERKRKQRAREREQQTSQSGTESECH